MMNALSQQNITVKSYTLDNQFIASKEAAK